MPYPEKTARNEQVFNMIEYGYTYSEVAHVFDINTTRVLQIYNAVFRKKFSHLNRKNQGGKTNG